MTDRVENKGRRVRTRTLFFLTTAGLVLSAFVATAKQRAVRPPSSPQPTPVVAAFADAQDGVTISNPLPTTSSVTTCFASHGSNTCQQATLAPNQTVTYPAFGASLGKTSDGILTISAALVERTPFLDGTLIGTFARTDGVRAFLPAPPSSTLLLYAVEPSAVRVNLLNAFSADIAETDISVRQNDVTRVPLSAIGIVGESYQLRLLVTAGACNAAIETMVAGKKALIPMQLESAARGTLYVPLIGTTTTILKNTSNTNVNVVRKDYLPPNTDNTNATTSQNVMLANNTITTEPNTFGNGGMRLTGNLQQDYTSQPFLAWHQLNGITVPLATAIIKNTCPSNTVISQDLDFSIGTGTYWLQNNTRLPTSGNFIIYDSAGNETGRVATTLKPYENQILTVSGSHVRYRLDTTTQCTESSPEVTVVALGEIPRAGYRVPRAGDKVSGEAYVHRWLDILREQYFFVDYPMSACLWQSTCGTPNYATSMAALLAQSSTTPIQDPTALLHAFKEITDGNPANDELTTKFSPMNIDLRNTGNLRIYLGPQGTSIIDWRFTPPDKAAVFSLFRQFAVAYFDANPTACGGTPATGCNLSSDPGFTNSLKPQAMTTALGM
jgi:hypothetical protein